LKQTLFNRDDLFNLNITRHLLVNNLCFFH